MDASDNFDLILQELQQQHELMEKLYEENRQLKQQIADLHEGRGIFIEILGQRIALVGDTVLAHTKITEEPKIEVRNIAVPGTASGSSPSSFETPLPQGNPNLKARVDSPALSFLEEALLDEFAAATTSPMAARYAPPPQSQPLVDENEKAILRRELMGSFLLE